MRGLATTRIQRWVWLFGASAALALGSPARAEAASLQLVGTYQAPVHITSDPNDHSRLFVVEQGGRIMLTEGGSTTTFANLTDSVASGGERGLLSVALDPEYASTGLLYVYYTRSGDGAIQVDELRADATGDAVLPASRRPVLTIPHPIFENHNGGQLQFGPDGYLYIGTGDGGGAGDLAGNAQNLDSLLGKLLRIDPRLAGTAPYSIPADNPFAGAVDGRDEIWSYGLRNPFRFSFDRQTGALTIGDVGQDQWEEVDYEPVSSGAGRGDNFGWNCREGAHPFGTIGCSTDPAAFTEPVLEYSHTDGNCSIDGGYVSRDPGVPGLFGRYLYADLCVGEIRSAVLDLPTASDDRDEGIAVGTPSSFGQDSCGRLYVASLATNQVLRIVGSSPTDCAAAPAPDPPPDPPGPGDPPGPNPGRCSGQIVGTDQSETLRGTGAAEVILGRGGDDELIGLRGDDCLDGGRGDDRLHGGGGDDELRGAAGDDTVRGGDGKDELRLGQGSDRAHLADGVPETVRCGSGRDQAILDGSDRARGCESVERLQVGRSPS